jgi:branched-subunit amino acid ABC-type transport system permease component
MEKTSLKLGLACWLLMGFSLALYTAFILLFSSQLPSQIPLWYSLPWGENQLAHLSDLFIIPTLIMVIAVSTNLILNKTKLGRIWQTIFGWSGILSESILLLALLRIWMLSI